MKLVDFSVERPVAISMLVLIIVVLGGVALSNLGLDLMPEIEYPMVSVVTSYEGASAEDVEALVTKPIEEMVATVSNVKKLRSFSQEGISVVMVEFEWGTNLGSASQDVRERMGLLEEFLPKDISKPLIMKFDISMMPVMFYGVQSDVYNQRELRKILNDSIKPRLERLEGVASAMLFGGELYEVRVSLDRHKLESFDISGDKVVQALRFENINMPAGHLERDHNEFLLRTIGEYADLKQMENTIVGASKFGIPIRLKDVGEVKLSPKDQRGLSRLNGKDNISLVIGKQSGANTLLVSKRVREEMGRIQKDISGVKLLSIYDQGQDISHITQQMSTNAISGAILAILFMLFFLRSIRPTLAIGLAIPISVIVTFIAIYVVGYTLNLMTLGGITLGVGMLVDNAIVVIENIFRHLESGKSRWQAAKIGTKEVSTAITASTFTTVVVFLPVVFSTGIAGRLTRGLALTVSISLFASLFVAFTIIPMFAAIFFKESGNTFAETDKRQVWFDKLREFYISVLKWSLGHRKTVLAVALVLFLLSLGLIPLAGAEFMPSIDTPVAMFMLRAPPGSALKETDRIVSSIEERTKELPESLAIMVNAGVHEGTKFDLGFSGQGTSDVNEAQVFVKLKRKEERSRSSQYLAELIRSFAPDLEGVKFQFLDMAQMMMGGQNTAPIEIKIFGKDLDKLKEIGEKIARKITSVKGIRDVDMTMREGKPEIAIKVDKDKALRLGLPTGVVAQAMKVAKLGEVATRYHEEGDEFDVRVIYEKDGIKNLEDITAISVNSLTGTRIPLSDVAQFVRREGPVKIERETQSRRVSVTANLSDRDIGSAMAEIKELVEPLKREIPIGYSVVFAGEYERMIETFVELFKAFLLAILFVYMVMAAQFESFRQPFIIMFTIPLSAIGIILMMLIFGKTVSLVSALGVLILAGIVVNNGIVLLDYVNRLRREQGLGVYEALIEGGKTRLRPILITAGTTIFGMFPMAFSTSQGSEMRSPMALTVVGGLFTATFLTLIVIPVVYSYFAEKEVGRGGEE